ncbi:MFS transporter [Roseicella sp. DB1501]|uniref:MFS transporter n=1 Tax=Roseicella sp. DB1501 TaxID=2730925 RepID=UPI001C2BABF1|nr:MFS transporter [Roseicella sp. DB1501]
MPSPTGAARRSLLVACAAHALHDGYTDLIYLLLPLWQAEFGLGFAVLAALRGTYVGSMALLQIPVGHLAGHRFSARGLLALGTVLAALGYAVAGASGGLAGLVLGLALSGAGSSTQHPIASAVVSRAYGTAARGPLGTYNFAGDLGKAALPATTSLLLAWLSWRPTLWLLAGFGIACAALIALGLPRRAGMAPARCDAASPAAGPGGARGGFALLLGIGVLDSAVRMGLLTFLPFLLQAKGADMPMVGFALSLVFLGGAAGKFVCGLLGARFGVLWVVLATEGGTALLILGLLALPLGSALAVLPLLGMLLNGTSSVLYGTVPELTAAAKAERAFAVFYTGTIGSGAVAPVLYGWLGDGVGVPWATVATAGTALATLPLAALLVPRLAQDRRPHG